MSVSIYKLSVPVFLRGLSTLSGLLDKAEVHARENGTSVEDFVNARLAPDMLPLAGQIQRISDTSKGAIGRLTALETPSFPDTEQTFVELRERVANTAAFLKTVTPSDMEDSAARDVTLSFKTFKATFSGDDYLVKFALPNFYFHLTTAYDILRNQGVALGKPDYFGSFE